jgi:hypothetical protein
MPTLNVVPHARVSWGDQAVVDEAMKQLNEHWKSGRLRHLAYAALSPEGDVTWRFSDNMRLSEIAIALAYMTADFHARLATMPAVERSPAPAA